jgi:hypothetical protein
VLRKVVLVPKLGMGNVAACGGDGSGITASNLLLGVSCFLARGDINSYLVAWLQTLTPWRLVLEIFQEFLRINIWHSIVIWVLSVVMSTARFMISYLSNVSFADKGFVLIIEHTPLISA